MNLNFVDELIAKFKASGLSVLEVEMFESFKVRMELPVNSNVYPQMNMGVPNYYQQPTVTTNFAQPETASEEVKESTAEDKSQYTYINSPMVGVFCSLEKISKKPLKSGDVIKNETIVCAVEAMKMVCEIEAEMSGEFVDYCVQEGDQIEFGQPLVKLKRV